MGLAHDERCERGPDEIDCACADRALAERDKTINLQRAYLATRSAGLYHTNRHDLRVRALYLLADGLISVSKACEVFEEQATGKTSVLVDTEPDWDTGDVGWKERAEELASALAAKDAEIAQLRGNNQRLQDTLKLHESPHVTMTTAYANDLEEARRERDVLYGEIERLKAVVAALRVSTPRDPVTVSADDEATTVVGLQASPCNKCLALLRERDEDRAAIRLFADSMEHDPSCDYVDYARVTGRCGCGAHEKRAAFHAHAAAIQRAQGG